VTQPLELVYGPVLSRRLGRSLGVDLVPWKTCTYDCVYCQLGRTTRRTIRRGRHGDVAAVRAEVDRALTVGPAPDVIALAGSGEPTLHLELGTIVRALQRDTRIPVAVLTNASLLWIPEVLDEVAAADIILPSLDAYDAPSFRAINRPVAGLGFEQLMGGLRALSHRCRERVWLEVFLVDGLNTGEAALARLAELVSSLAPARVQLNTAVRPGAEPGVRAASRQQMRAACRIFGDRAEIIAALPSRQPGPSARPGTDADILALLQRRPSTIGAIAGGLHLVPAEVAKRIDALARQGLVTIVPGEKEVFFTVQRTS
jgi:wyosine [tRNA(Phe)-imidazoG37] synthetase (radical SAM superfamily)